MPDLIERGVIQSFEVAEQLFGYTYHALMVPPYPMTSALFLGFGQGQVPALMEKIWPVGCEIVGVDKNHPGEPVHNCSVFFQKNAEDFARISERVYDFVCIDIYDGNKVPKFVFSKEFVKDISRITGKMLAVNATFTDWFEWEPYDEHFLIDCVKQANLDRVCFFVPKAADPIAELTK